MSVFNSKISNDEQINKFSNVNLFDRREKQNFEKNKSKTLTASHFNHHDKKFTSILPYLTQSTLNSSRINQKSRNVVSNYQSIFSDYNNDENLKSIYSTINSNFSNLYLTELNKSHNKKNKKKIKIFDSNQKFNTIDSNVSSQKNIFFPSTPLIKNKFNNNNNNTFNNNYHIHKNSDNLEILKNFEKQINSIKCYSDRNNYNTQLDRKTKKLNSTKKYKNELLDKTRLSILFKYTLDIKKERVVRLKEQYDNKLENVNDSINTMIMAKELFLQKFLIKFNDYVKYLTQQREIEKLKNSQLLNVILNHKKDISNIEAKIRKISQEKNFLLRWIYLLIQIKEKKKELPDYYKNIFENNSTQNEINKTASPKKIARRDSVKKYGRKMTRVIHDAAAINKVLHRRMTRKSSTRIMEEEYARIQKYKTNLIFEDYNDFIYNFQQFENETILKINEYNDIRYTIEELKNEKNFLELQENENNIKIEKLIQEKEIELINIKEKNKKLLKEIEKGNNILEENNFKKNSYKLKDNLFQKVLQLFSNTQKIGFINVIDISTLNQKKIVTKEEIIIDYLQKIEFVIDYLVNQFDSYNKFKNSYLYDNLRKIRNEIEKNHKIQKNMEQKLLEKERIKKLKIEIAKRYNKVNFISKRKTNDYYEIILKKEKKIIKNDDFIKDPKFEDFMYE